MPLHPVVAELISQAAKAGRPALSAGSPEDARALVRGQRAALGRGPDLHEVRELEVRTRSGRIGARLYKPVQDPAGLVVYLHGGGWVLGELDDFDSPMRALAKRSGCALLAPDYRLAPEHPFPAALEDAEDAILWASRHVSELARQEAPLVVAGDSAGANLAIVAVQALAGKVRPAAQVLIYPVTDSDMETESYRAYGESLLLTRADMEWFFRHYAPARLHDDPRISPLRAADLAGSPPTVLVTAEYDLLRDEGESYARRVAREGVAVMARRAAGLPHGFIRLHNLVDTADAELSAIAGEIERACDVCRSVAENRQTRLARR